MGKVLLAVAILFGVILLFGVSIGLLGPVVERSFEESVAVALTVYDKSGDEPGAEEIRIGRSSGRHKSLSGGSYIEFGNLSTGRHNLTYTYGGEFHQVQIEVRGQGGFVVLSTGLPLTGPDDRVVVVDFQGPQAELRRASDQQIKAEFRLN